jgi:hypothetical protein
MGTPRHVGTPSSAGTNTRAVRHVSPGPGHVVHLCLHRCTSACPGCAGQQHGPQTMVKSRLPAHGPCWLCMLMNCCACCRHAPPVLQGTSLLGICWVAAAGPSLLHVHIHTSPSHVMCVLGRSLPAQGTTGQPAAHTEGAQDNRQAG